LAAQKRVLDAEMLDPEERAQAHAQLMLTMHGSGEADRGRLPGNGTGGDLNECAQVHGFGWRTWA
jgi:hypothetical protein